MRSASARQLSSVASAMELPTTVASDGALWFCWKERGVMPSASKIEA